MVGDRLEFKLTYFLFHLCETDRKLKNDTDNVSLRFIYVVGRR